MPYDVVDKLYELRDIAIDRHERTLFELVYYLKIDKQSLDKMSVGELKRWYNMLVEYKEKEREANKPT